MILSTRAIKRAIRDGDLKFEPGVDDDQIKQVSVDLRVGRKFSRFNPKGTQHIAVIRMHKSLWDSEELWKDEEADICRVEPGHLVLASTLEEVTLSGKLAGFVEGRSGYARIGLSVHITAPKIDPGFSGPITLEMTNIGEKAIELVAGEDMPAQLILMQVSPHLTKKELYGIAPGSTFQHQTGPIPRSGRKRSKS